MRMADKNFSSLSALEAEIQKQINSVLKQEMSEMIKEKISQHVKTDVYDVYPNPIEYERRDLQNGSLGDEERMDSHLIGDGVLEVVNNNDFNHPWAYNHEGYGDIDTNKSLTFNIEYGYGDKDTVWNKSRSFIENTREEIRSKNLHIETMKSALKTRLGIGSVK